MNIRIINILYHIHIIFIINLFRQLNGLVYYAQY
jgi:hypothetical protein